MLRRTFFRFVNFLPVYMPALSPSMETGTLVEWKKQIGDLVKENDVFCTIQTDKAVVDYTNTFEEGYLANIYCHNGQVAPVAQTIAVMVDEEADVSKGKEYVPEDGAGASEESAAAEPAVAAPAAAAAPAASASSAQGSSGVSSDAPEDVNCMPVYMPALSPSMETGTLVEWKKQIGDLVKENDVFCTIQTDKAVVDYTNTFEEGYLANIYCHNGQVAPVAQTIAMMVSEAADVPKVKNYYPADAVGAGEATQSATTAPPAAAAAPSASSAAASAAHAVGTKEQSEMIQRSGPSVMRIASGLAPDVLSGVRPTGKGGRYVKSDFVNLPGFDYNDAVAAPSSRPTATSADAAHSASASKSKPSKPSAAQASTGTQSGVWDVATQPGIVVKSLDDTQLLQRLLKGMS